MTEDHETCEHRWRYYVNVESRAVRVRHCELCGRRAALRGRHDVARAASEAAKIPA